MAQRNIKVGFKSDAEYHTVLSEIRRYTKLGPKEFGRAAMLEALHQVKYYYYKAQEEAKQKNEELRKQYSEANNDTNSTISDSGAEEVSSAESKESSEVLGVGDSERPEADGDL